MTNRGESGNRNSWEWDAWSCDLRPTEREETVGGGKAQHYRGDVRDILDGKALGNGRPWDLLIAHPPCTYLTKQSSSIFNRPGYKHNQQVAIRFFELLLKAPVCFVAVENPIPLRILSDTVGNFTQKIHPWQFGHTAQKATCLWLRNLPKLKPSNDVWEETKSMSVMDRQWLMLGMTPSGQGGWMGEGGWDSERQKQRSVTFLGIAQAMADQWGAWVEKCKAKWRNKDG